jgi:hypothetical protein
MANRITTHKITATRVYQLINKRRSDQMALIMSVYSKIMQIATKREYDRTGEKQEH